MSDEFSYTIVEKNQNIIVTFNGDMGRDAVEKLDDCQRRLVSMSGTNFIIYFRSVDKIEHSVFRNLTLLQKSLRDKNFPLWLVGLRPHLKALLNEKGLIRLSETTKSISDFLS